MSLTNHQYRFFSNKKELLEIWKDRINNFSGDIVLAVFGVWDQNENKWFNDAPMIVKFSSCTLTVNVKSEMQLSLGLNDLDYNEKPVWFDETDDSQIIKELSWSEDLVWKPYFGVEQCFGKIIGNVNIIGDDKTITGIDFGFIDKSSLTIKDAGDVIVAFYAV